MNSSRALILALAVAAFGCRPGLATRPAPEAQRWWKGNLHTHSLWSDGDDFPEMIVGWYRGEGYDFVAISDHNTLGDGERWLPVPAGSARAEVVRRYRERFGNDWVEERRVNDTIQVRLKTLREYRPMFEEPGRFLIIQSEEISDAFRNKPLHVNATNVQEKIEPQRGNSVREVLQNNIDAVLAQRARTGTPMFPHVNHPNFGWAVTVEDLIALEGERFFELYNGHPLVHNFGDHLHPGTERMWDILLAERVSKGREVMYGLATDDSHHYHDWSAERANPGRGWIQVRAAELTPASLIAAMERGDFYATNGVVLRDVRREASRLVVDIRSEPGVTYVTQFIGTRRGYNPHSIPVVDEKGDTLSRRYSDEVGEVLAEVRGASASYRIRGDELYVRAKIVSSKPKVRGYRQGEMEVAWTQPWVIAAPKGRNGR